MSKDNSLKKRIQKILRGKSGFTMTELLVAALIMALATATITSVIVVAFRNFYKTVQRTEAQFLCASLAEFVEDELMFSNKVTVSPTGDISWSGGTHNMGSNISFYVNTGTGAYTKVSGSTPNTYGRIVITGDNYSGKYFKAVTDGSYDVEKGRGYSLLAGMSLEWDASNELYKVKIVVVDKDNKSLLSDEEFTVKPPSVTV